ncbi:gamma-glutamylcyclotransferase family protein [Sediminicola sp. 1XM1-17]|uniref:gamma-glutamylcyclotransferase family protein n=1 Tax=Sediminicola sp. 1XM1-17 TaxID=3127702 RepID=UPI003077835D
MREPIELFTYGTLQDLEIQFRLFGRKLTGYPDALIGYEMSDKKIMGKYKVIHESQNQNNSLKGVRYTMEFQELLITDTYEGKAYKRILVTLASGKKAWVYVENSI